MKIREATATDNVLAREIVQASLATFGLTAEFEAGGQDDAVGRLGSGENAVELVAELDGGDSAQRQSRIVVAPV